MVCYWHKHVAVSSHLDNSYKKQYNFRINPGMCKWTIGLKSRNNFIKGKLYEYKFSIKNLLLTTSFQEIFIFCLVTNFP